MLWPRPVVGRCEAGFETLPTKKTHRTKDTQFTLDNPSKMPFGLQEFLGCPAFPSKLLIATSCKWGSSRGLRCINILTNSRVLEAMGSLMIMSLSCWGHCNCFFAGCYCEFCCHPYHNSAVLLAPPHVSPTQALKPRSGREGFSTQAPNPRQTSGGPNRLESCAFSHKIPSCATPPLHFG